MAIIVGDVHGNVEKARAFLEYKPEVEHVALGDYLDSFTEPVERQVTCFRMLVDSSAILLWGNHDLHYLAKPPFICTGYQYKHEQVYRALIENTKPDSRPLMQLTAGYALMPGYIYGLEGGRV